MTYILIIDGHFDWVCSHFWDESHFLIHLLYYFHSPRTLWYVIYYVLELATYQGFQMIYYLFLCTLNILMYVVRCIMGDIYHLYPSRNSNKNYTGTPMGVMDVKRSEILCRIQIRCFLVWPDTHLCELKWQTQTVLQTIFAIFDHFW